jgi:hypothetical protein
MYSREKTEKTTHSGLKPMASQKQILSHYRTALASGIRPTELAVKDAQGNTQAVMPVKNSKSLRADRLVDILANLCCKGDYLSLHYRLDGFAHLTENNE